MRMPPSHNVLQGLPVGCGRMAGLQVGDGDGGGVLQGQLAEGGIDLRSQNDNGEGVTQSLHQNK